LTLLVNTILKKATPLDDALPSREMEEIHFEEVNNLDPPVPERIALLTVAPVGEVIDGLGVNRGAGVFVVCEK
jgi:hypothetical protein